MHILGIMNSTLGSHKTNVSGHAPRIITLKVKPEKIREIIGPGGKVIRGIIEATGVKMDVEDDGTVTIASSDEEASKKAVEMVQKIAAEAEVGKIYKGTVRKIVDFGAFVEIFPGTDGLVHISQLSENHVAKVKDVLKVGQEVESRVIKVDKVERRIGLSIKAANYSEEELRKESEAFDTLRPGEDMVGLEKAFAAAEQEEYRPGEAKKEPKASKEPKEAKEPKESKRESKKESKKK